MPHRQIGHKKGTSSPIGAVVPDYEFQLYLDTENKKIYISNGLTSSDWEQICGIEKSIVTVGISGADYDNFDAAIDYLRTLNGGIIVIISNMTISGNTKDISNIHFIGNKYGAESRQLNKTVDTGYWHGKNVVFANFNFWRIMDTGGNEIFKFMNDFEGIKMDNVLTVGMSGNPVTFNCNSKEIDFEMMYSAIGMEGSSYLALSNQSKAIFHLYNGSCLYETGTIDYIRADASAIIDGNPTVTSGIVLADKTSKIENDSSVTGDTVKDALNNLTEKNGVDGTFTTVDEKTITIVDGQVTSIV